MKKVKILKTNDEAVLEEIVNRFIRALVVHDIKFSMTHGLRETYYAAMIIYEGR